MIQLENTSKIKDKKGGSFIYKPEGIYFSESKEYNIILKGECSDYTNKLKLLNTDCFSKLFPKLNIQICDK